MQSTRGYLNPRILYTFVNRCSTTVTQAKADAQVKPYDQVPGPKPWPIIGNLWMFLPGMGHFTAKNINVVQKTLYDSYGQIVKIAGIPRRNDMVFVYDAQDIETVFRNEGPYPIRGNFHTILYYRQELRKDFFQGTDGVVFTAGKKWYDFRSKVNQSLLQPKNVKLYVGPIDEVTSDFIERLKTLRNDRGELPADTINHFLLWALESICLIALDTRLGCLAPHLKPDSEPKKMIDAVHVMFNAMFEIDFKPSIVHFTRRKLWKDLVKSLDTFNDIAMVHIRNAMNRIQNRGIDEDYEVSVLESLLLKNDNPLIACVMAIDMLMAGIDTTSHTSATVLHYLARNLDKQEKLFLEVKRILPSKDQKITAQNLEDMKYLKACIKEAMRMSPIVSGNMRTSVKDLVLSNYHIPKGTDLLVPLLFLGRQEQHFEKPDSYLPERWLKDENQKKANPFVFLPFGFGPRSCIGRRFALLEMETLIAKIVRNFHLEYDVDLEMVSGAITMVSSPLTFKLTERP